MKVYWLEQTETCVPTECDWLSTRELVQLTAMRFAKRRADWHLGRWTAKNAVAACLQLPADLRNLRKIELRPAPSGAPEVFFANKPAPVRISLSHRAGIAVCAVALSKGALGCDLETIEQRSDAFVRDYFIIEEQELIAQTAEDDRPLLVTLLWSAKESALKALRAGLRLDTRCVIVTLLDALRSQDEYGEDPVQEEYPGHGDSATAKMDGVNGWRCWRPLRVRHIDGQTFHGWWQHTSNLVRTMVSAPPSAPPVLLNIPPSSINCPSAVGSDQDRAA